MNLNLYPLNADENSLSFEFVSIGPKGKILKVVQLALTDVTGIYNLGLGDKNLMTGTIDYLSVLNNQDSEKILSTVAAAVYLFTERLGDAWVFIEGVTDARTRLFQMGISKYFEAASEDFLFSDK